MTPRQGSAPPDLDVMTRRGSRPLDAAEINQLDLVEIIMRAPLDQAVTVAVGRASTCWEYPEGMGGPPGVFDDQTAVQITHALLARISAELAVESARIRGEDEAAARIPTLAFPTEAVEHRQCPSRLRIEGMSQHSQCLLLEGGHGEHQNGALRWRDAAGEITAWWDDTAYEVMSLGDLLRAGNVHLTLPHLPADVVSGPDDPPPALPPAVSKSAPEAQA